MKSLIAFTIFLAACSSNGFFLTEDLPKAKVGNEYYAEIHTKKVGVIEDMFYIDTDFSEGLGIDVLSHQSDNSDFPHSLIVISGTPKYSGQYNITITTIVRNGNKEVSKKYKLEVDK